jgi:hypothetical protein
MENLGSDDALPIDDESGLLLDPDFGNGVAGPIVRSEVWRKTWAIKPYLHVFSCLPTCVSHSSAPCGALWQSCSSRSCFMIGNFRSW